VGNTSVDDIYLAFKRRNGLIYILHLLKELFKLFALFGLRPNEVAATLKPIGAIASNGY